MDATPTPTPRWRTILLTWVLPVAVVSGGVTLHWVTQVPKGPMEPRPKPKPKRPRKKKRPKKPHKRNKGKINNPKAKQGLKPAQLGPS